MAQNVSQWGANFETKAKCKDCDQDIEIPISPNPVSFFI